MLTFAVWRQASEPTAVADEPAVDWCRFSGCSSPRSAVTPRWTASPPPGPAETEGSPRLRKYIRVHQDSCCVSGEDMVFMYLSRITMWSETKSTDWNNERTQMTPDRTTLQYMFVHWPTTLQWPKPKKILEAIIHKQTNKQTWIEVWQRCCLDRTNMDFQHTQYEHASFLYSVNWCITAYLHCWQSNHVSIFHHFID